VGDAGHLEWAKPATLVVDENATSATACGPDRPRQWATRRTKPLQTNSNISEIRFSIVSTTEHNFIIFLVTNRTNTGHFPLLLRDFSLIQTATHHWKPATLSGLRRPNLWAKPATIVDDENATSFLPLIFDCAFARPPRMLQQSAICQRRPPFLPLTAKSNTSPSCNRVLGYLGGLWGFGWGEPLKESLQRCFAPKYPNLGSR